MKRYRKNLASRTLARTIAAADFFTGFYETALEANEVITQIRVPIPGNGTGSSYQKFTQPASRFAIVGCAAMVRQSNGVCDQVRVAFTGVSEFAFRDEAVEAALTGKAPTAENIAAAVSNAAADVSIMSDHFASEDYRRHLAAVYAKRALTAATS